MATINQIKVNTGTEDSPTYVLHDVHDKRLDDGASSLVTTCTHLLATNAALSSFNPITSANLASVLGVNKRGRVDATTSTNMKAVIPNDVSGNSGFLIYGVYGRSFSVGVCTYEYNGGITTLKEGFGTVDYTNNELSITLPGTTKGTVDYVIYSFNG